MLVYPVPIALMCCRCKRPYFSQNIREKCPECGDVVECLSLMCKCSSTEPTYAMAPEGRCEHCGSLLTESGFALDDDLDRLKELLARQKGTDHAEAV